MDCLDENSVVEYIEGLLPAESVEQIEDHLDSCPLCRQAVLEVAGAANSTFAPTLRTGTQQTETGHTAPRWLEEMPGRYAIRKEHGRGGQARVYMAFDEYMGREVALKVLLPSGSQDNTRQQADSAVRFMREVRIAGQLNHPSIVNVHERGRRADGSLYYTMEFVRGQTLATMLDSSQGMQERLRILPHFFDVCNGIAYAQSRGVLHRDLKPANIMVGEFGETILLDWGLAAAPAEGYDQPRSTDNPADPPSFTADGTALGTPSYMSPEQACGDVSSIDERTDVWGLGAILFEILTGRPPFEGASSGEIIRKAKTHPVPPVREINSTAPAELAAVADRALERSKDKRYASAKQLADEVNAYLTGHRVEAHEYGPWELFRLFAKRHWVALTAGGTVFAAILAALVVVFFSYRSELDARRAEQKERRLASFHLAQAYADRAKRALQDRDRLSARILAAASLSNNPAHDRSPLYDPGFLEQAPQSAALRLTADSTVFATQHRWFSKREAVLPLDAESHGVTFLGDGRLSAGTVQGTLTVWPETGSKPLFSVRANEKGINRISASPDGTQLAASGRGGDAWIFDALTGKLLHTLSAQGVVFYSIVFSPDGKTLLTGGTNDEIRLWNSASGELLRSIPHATPGSKETAGPVLALAFSPDGKRFASAGAVRNILIWSAEGNHVATLAGHDGPGVFGLAFSPDGKLLASAGMDQTVRLWDSATGEPKTTLSGSKTDFMSVAFSPDGKLLAGSGHDGSIHLWDPLSGEKLGMVRAHHQIVYGLSFSPDSRRLASAGFDRTVKVWEISQPLSTLPLTRANANYGCVAFSPDGRLLAVADEQHLGLWDHRERRMLRELKGDWPGIDGLAWSKNSKLLAMGGDDGALWVFDAGTGKPVMNKDLGERAVAGLAFAPGDSRLATVSTDGTLRMWEMSTLATQAEQKPCEGINDIAFSPDGRWIAIACLEDGTKVLRSDDLELAVHLPDPDTTTLDAVFSPDGRHLATARMDGSIVVWEMPGGNRERVLEGHTNRVHCIEFSPDGRWFATSSRDQTVRLWSTVDWRPLLALPAASSVFSHSFSPASDLLAFGDAEGTRLIRLDLDSLQGDPSVLLTEALDAAGMDLDGYVLTPSRIESRQQQASR